MIRFALRQTLNQAPLKVVSFIIGYSLWNILSCGRSAQCTLDVPICFYGTHENSVITAPEKVTVTLKAARQELARIDINALAVHIDGATLKPGRHLLTVTSEKLFLPERVSVVYYEPLNIMIDVTNQTPLPNSTIST